MSTDTINRLIAAGAIAGILLLVLALVDFLINRWKYFRMFGSWASKQVSRLKIDPTPVTLRIPPGVPSITLPATTADGVSKVCVMYVMSGPDRLLAYEVTRKGFPGTRFLVERHLPKQQPRYCDTPNRDEANAQWSKWYDEWRAKPSGFGGASGAGLSGKLPWQPL
jgi:hypothetical protein